MGLYQYPVSLSMSQTHVIYIYRFLYSCRFHRWWALCTRNVILPVVCGLKSLPVRKATKGNTTCNVLLSCSFHLDFIVYSFSFMILPCSFHFSSCFFHVLFTWPSCPLVFPGCIKHTHLEKVIQYRFKLVSWISAQGLRCIIFQYRF